MAELLSYAIQECGVPYHLFKSSSLPVSFRVLFIWVLHTFMSDLFLDILHFSLYFNAFLKGYFLSDDC